ncbi:MAG: gliding motility-associated protein GldE [Bacteroidota bacterium]|nr:gliding motility-associated protein GldE [Bacteroidota bacterium]MEC7955352.1 gliding motility-associated protein GldE [Bacteroidota bacterium]MEC8004837.1 gliding motility-associated protein GldE [Bacteroidota bacterium]
MVVLSALLSGSEVAMFSISNKQRFDLEDQNKNANKRVLTLLKEPKKLLATILIANNFINVSIVMASNFVFNNLIIEGSISDTMNFIIQVIVITFLILLFGEVIPKVYANNYNLKFSKFMAIPLQLLKKLFYPISQILVNSTNLIDKRIEKRKESIQANELEHALNLTVDSVDNEDEKKILEGIVKFGNTDVKQIMTPRTDVISFEITTPFNELMSELKEIKYSRIPVFEDSFDKIKGILYAKDLLGKMNEKKNFKWPNLLREPKFVPENKKLDDLLKEFQEEKTHIAIVVDEYGGSSGIVSLEDVLEEIVGEITDEFDEEDVNYKKLDELNYIFDGKTTLIDIYKLLDIDGEIFEKEKGESDTIAGFCIEQAGKILLKNEKISFDRYTITVEAADKRRIKKVKITINEVV